MLMERMNISHAQLAALERGEYVESLMGLNYQGVAAGEKIGVFAWEYGDTSPYPPPYQDDIIAIVLFKEAVARPRGIKYTIRIETEEDRKLEEEKKVIEKQKAEEQRKRLAREEEERRKIQERNEEEQLRREQEQARKEEERKQRKYLGQCVECGEKLSFFTRYVGGKEKCKKCE